MINGGLSGLFYARVILRRERERVRNARRPPNEDNFVRRGYFIFHTHTPGFCRMFLDVEIEHEYFVLVCADSLPSGGGETKFEVDRAREVNIVEITWQRQTQLQCQRTETENRDFCALQNREPGPSSPPTLVVVPFGGIPRDRSLL